MKRKVRRRYRNVKRNSGVKFLGFVGIMIGAVICGYLTARFVVAPLLGYETEVLKLDFPSKLTALTEETERKEEQKSDSTVDDGKYVLQFGVFSSKSGAEELVQSLKQKKIDARIKAIDGSYKVLSDTFQTKETALKELEQLKEKQNIDVFITSIE